MLWTIELNYGLVADGELLEIVTGQILEWFAIEFTGEMLVASHDCQNTAREHNLGIYSVDAEVIFLSESAIILDCGIRVVGDPKSLSLPKDIQTGRYVTGEICLQIPLCTAPYPEELNKSLQTKLRIRKILADTAPQTVRQDANGVPVVWRGLSRKSYAEVGSLTATCDRYLLLCESEQHE